MCPSIVCIVFFFDINLALVSPISVNVVNKAFLQMYVLASQGKIHDFGNGGGPDKC